MFFGFTLTIFICCILLVINSLGGSSRTAISAVEISDDVSDPVYHAVKEPSVPVEKIPAAAEGSYGYSDLTEQEEKDLYEMISQSVVHISDEPDENGNYSTERLRINGIEMSQESIRHTLNAYICDHPQIFWLRNLFGYAYSGGDTIVECYSVMSAHEVGERAEQLAVSVRDILKDIDAEMPPYEKEKLIHDRLLAGCTYKQGISSMSDGWEYFSVYGALVRGEAVCEGYAKSMQLLLSLAGMDCCTIRGRAEGVEHMWNLVCIRESWYHVDPTWDDKDDIISYEYFNITTEDISQNHTISPSMDEAEQEGSEKTESLNFFVPDCTARYMNYYNVEALRLSQLGGESDQRMIDFMYERAERKDIYIPLFILPTMEYNECIDEMFYTSPYKFYYYVDEVNSRLNKGYKIDRESIKILKNEKNMTLRIRVSYIPS